MAEAPAAVLMTIVSPYVHGDHFDLFSVYIIDSDTPMAQFVFGFYYQLLLERAPALATPDRTNARRALVRTRIVPAVNRFLVAMRVDAIHSIEARSLISRLRGLPSYLFDF